MSFSSGLSIFSEFSKKLEVAKQLSAVNCKQRAPLTEEAKQRQKEVQKAWRDKRKAENLAQRELIMSKR